MNRNSTSSMGALHPIFFFVIVYSISLFLALFVCSTVYYTFNEPAESEQEAFAQQQTELGNSQTETAYR
jgi:hypothetical protein